MITTFFLAAIAAITGTLGGKEMILFEEIRERNLEYSKQGQCVGRVDRQTNALPD